MKKVSKIITLSCFIMMVIGAIVYVFLDRFIGFSIGFFFNVLLILMLYTFLSKEIKSESLYMNNTLFRNLLLLANAIIWLTTLIGLLFKIMHWPFAGPILLISMIGIVPLIVLFIIDIFYSIKKKIPMYGYQYFLVLCPLIIFLQGNFFKWQIGEQHFRDKYYEDVNDKKELLFSLNKKSFNYINDKNTISIIKYLNDLKQKQIEVCGGYNQDGTYRGANEKTAVEVHMIGPEGSEKGEAYKLQKRLQDFEKEKDIKLSSLELPLNVKRNPDKKSFAEFYFHNTSLTEAVYVLEMIELDIIMNMQNKQLTVSPDLKSVTTEHEDLQSE